MQKKIKTNFNSNFPNVGQIGRFGALIRGSQMSEGVCVGGEGGSGDQFGTEGVRGSGGFGLTFVRNGFFLLLWHKLAKKELLFFA